MIFNLNNIIVNLGEITLNRKVYISCFILLMFQYYNAISNDGAYLGSGNHLVPIVESDISIKKEILSIKKYQDKVHVDVYYEMYNPGKEKTIRVGFEAKSPGGDAQIEPSDGKHPYMNNFTVIVNNENLKYNISYLINSYDETAIGKPTTLSGILNYLEENSEGPYYYVYYFDAKYKSGLNIIKHSYEYKLSSSIVESYSFDYILTAANRWANKQIDDFTINIDMGAMQGFYIKKTFYNNVKEWNINGIGKSKEGTETGMFFIENGNIELKHLNFHPKGEIEIISPNSFGLSEEQEEYFNPKKTKIPFSVSSQDNIPEAKTEFGKKILRNLPFARRGYVFKDKEVQKYYSKMTEWYTPNPSYVPDVQHLLDEEKEWVKLYK